MIISFLDRWLVPPKPKKPASFVDSVIAKVSFFFLQILLLHSFFSFFSTYRFFLLLFLIPLCTDRYILICINKFSNLKEFATRIFMAKKQINDKVIKVFIFFLTIAFKKYISLKVFLNDVLILKLGHTVG